VQKPVRASPSGNASASPPASPAPLTNSRHGSSLLLLYLCLVCLVGCMRLLTCTCRHDLPAQERDIIEPSSRNGIPVGLKRSCLPHVNFLHAHAKRGVVAGQEARRTPNVLLCWSETLINDTSQRGTRILHIDARDGLSGGGALLRLRLSGGLRREHGSEHVDRLLAVHEVLSEALGLAHREQ
jgi:hypothetical protein